MKNFERLTQKWIVDPWVGLEGVRAICLLLIVTFLLGCFALLFALLTFCELGWR